MPSDVLGTQLLPIGLQDGPLLHWSVIAGTKIDTGAVRIDHWFRCLRPKMERA